MLVKHEEMMRTLANQRMEIFQVVFTSNQFVDFRVAELIVSIVLWIDEISLYTAKCFQLDARKLFSSERPHLRVYSVVDHASSSKQCEEVRILDNHCN